MPFLQIFVSRDKSEAEAQAALNNLRDNFPLRQSQGRFYHMSSHYIVFEQPEHQVLTLEQELWMEQHGHNPDYGTRFYDFQDQGCRECFTPFDDSPTGYCPQCHTTDPYKITAFDVQFSIDEFSYIQRMARHGWNRSEGDYMYRHAMTLVDLIERAKDRSTVECLFGTERLPSLAADFIAANICYECQLPLSQCSHNTHKTSQTIRVPFTRQEYAHVQGLADERGLSMETFIRNAPGIPDVQMAAATRASAGGRVFSCDLSFFLSYFERPYTPHIQVRNKQLPHVASFGGSDGKQIPLAMYHLTQNALSLVQHLPLLDDHIIEMLIDLARRQRGESYLAWCREQLAQEEEDHAIPCTAQEIAGLEHEINCTLPEAYKEFLAWMGRGAGSFMQYLNCFYPALAHQQREARTLLEQDACSAPLSEDAFVFYMQPQQQFAFFRASEGADPPIYAHRRNWRRMPFMKIYHHFSDFLEVQVAMHAEYRRLGTFCATDLKDHHTCFLDMTARAQEAVAQKRVEPGYDN